MFWQCLPKQRKTPHSVFLLNLAIGLLMIAAPAGFAQEAADPPEVVLGERLFLETRFAQFFRAFLDQGGTINEALPAGDPVVDTTDTTGHSLPGPFAGQSMNCRACHLVDEHLARRQGGMRTYSDFARRSPIPLRADGKSVAPRNAPSLVNASLPRRGGLLLHLDGEFSSLTDLIVATYTGRNFGWLPGEQTIALAHIATVVRADNGQGALAQDFGSLPYAALLTGTDPAIPAELRLPAAFRVPVATATDGHLVHAVARLVAAYTDSLVFSQDEAGNFQGSPYDVFLQKNHLPRQSAPQETDLAYSRRLLALLKQREQQGLLQFVTANPHTDNGALQFHAQPFTFGPREWRGLQIFFREPGGPLGTGELTQGGMGNCIACHPAPNFTDFRFHNTGTTQVEYDRLHGAGAFARLDIPGLWRRNAHPNAYLPATPQRPLAQEPFRAVPSLEHPEHADLGLWNIFANPDFPAPQERLRRLLCAESLQTAGPVDRRCRARTLLRMAMARFKTPGLRDLGHSAPYMHNGQFDTLTDVLALYRTVSDLSRAGELRNGASALRGLALSAADLGPLRAFLRALNEDYE